MPKGGKMEEDINDEEDLNDDEEDINDEDFDDEGI